jgi:hypothetical protein
MQAYFENEQVKWREHHEEESRKERDLKRRKGGNIRKGEARNVE